VGRGARLHADAQRPARRSEPVEAGVAPRWHPIVSGTITGRAAACAQPLVGLKEILVRTIERAMRNASGQPDRSGSGISVRVSSAASTELVDVI
jgi:hypothetical protein